MLNRFRSSRVELAASTKSFSLKMDAAQLISWPYIAWSNRIIAALTKIYRQLLSLIDRKRYRKKSTS